MKTRWLKWLSCSALLSCGFAFYVPEFDVDGEHVPGVSVTFDADGNLLIDQQDSHVLIEAASVDEFAKFVSSGKQ